MLIRMTDEARLLERAARWGPGYPLYLGTLLNRSDQAGPQLVLTDDVQRCDVVVLGGRGRFFVVGDRALYRQAMEDLFERATDPPGVWPDAATKARWAEEDGRERFRLGFPGSGVLEAALAAGFERDTEEERDWGAYFYYATGEPRFGRHVKHPCRVVHGLELYDHMRLGIDYDERGEYTRQCLEQGPSFVCEVPREGGGVEPVCWSCTHLGGTMGMIYTPPEHRRKGFARSLAAFQIDYMLAREGTAMAYVFDWNEASLRLLESFGVERLQERLGRCTLLWPERAPGRPRR